MILHSQYEYAQSIALPITALVIKQTAVGYAQVPDPIP